MTQEDKQLLLKDLSGRLFCGVKYTIYDDKTGNTAETLLDIRTSIENEIEIDLHSIEDVKLYLRSMSSMTDEEKEEFKKIMRSCTEKILACPTNERWYQFFDAEEQDFMNAHHFDYRGLIPMGLALEAPEGMYKTEYANTI